MKRPRVPPTLYKLTRITHEPMHAAYFGLVAWESHKWYGIVAGALLCYSIAHILFVEEDEHDADS